MSGVELLHLIQSVHSPFLDRFFGWMTHLHDTWFYVLVVPLFYWLYDKRFTRYIVSVLMISVWSNGLLKDLFNTARPTAADTLRQLYTETALGGAFPSGHAQGPMMFFGALALHMRKAWVAVAAGLIIFLIGYSRLYGGVHWPLDTLGGWVIGLAMLWFFEVTRRFWVGEGFRLRDQLISAVLIPLGTLAIWSGASWNAPLAEAGEAYKVAGAYMGFWVGAILEERYVGFNPRFGGLLFHVLKVLGGVVLVFAVKEGLKVVFPDLAVMDVVRYGLMSLSATYLVPWVCKRFGAGLNLRSAA